MGRQNKITCFIAAVLLIACSVSFAQRSSTDILLGTVSFKGKSTKLTKIAKTKLDSLVKQIKDNPLMLVRAVASNKDFCDKCDASSWDRMTAVLTYLSKQGIADDRLVGTGTQQGEADKVELFLTEPVAINDPHPLIKAKEKVKQR